MDHVRYMLHRHNGVQLFISSVLLVTNAIDRSIAGAIGCVLCRNNSQRGNFFCTAVVGVGVVHVWTEVAYLISAPQWQGISVDQ